MPRRSESEKMRALSPSEQVRQMIPLLERGESGRSRALLGGAGLAMWVGGWQLPKAAHYFFAEGNRVTFELEAMRDALSRMNVAEVAITLALLGVTMSGLSKAWSADRRFEKIWSARGADFALPRPR